MLTLNTNYTLNTINLLKSIAELETQQTQNTIPATPVAQQQEAAPKYTKTIKTPKKAAKATIKSTFKSFSIQRGYYIPSQNKTSILEVAHTTTLNISCITLGYSLTCKVNGEAQTSVVGDADYCDWKLKLQAGDRVEIEVLGGKSTKTITYTINEDGVVAVASEGVNHALKGTHKETLDIQDKYRVAAQQQTVAAPAQVEETTVEVAPVAQEVSAQVEEETAPAQTEEQVITFGKHAGEVPSALSDSYLKWLVSHESRLVEGNRWACTAARDILAARQTQQQQAA